MIVILALPHSMLLIICFILEISSIVVIFNNYKIVRYMNPLLHQYPHSLPENRALKLKNNR